MFVARSARQFPKTLFQRNLFRVLRKLLHKKPSRVTVDSERESE